VAGALVTDWFCELLASQGSRVRLAAADEPELVELELLVVLLPMSWGTVTTAIELPAGSLPLWQDSWIMYVRPALSVPARSARTSTVTVAGDPSGEVAEFPTPVKSGPCFAVG
jgi:hypothetical protein